MLPFSTHRIDPSTYLVFSIKKKKKYIFLNTFYVYCLTCSTSIQTWLQSKPPPCFSYHLIVLPIHVPQAHGASVLSHTARTTFYQINLLPMAISLLRIQADTVSHFIFHFQHFISVDQPVLQSLHKSLDWRYQYFTVILWSRKIMDIQT